jgi:hypothetical protein
MALNTDIFLLPLTQDTRSSTSIAGAFMYVESSVLDRKHLLALLRPLQIDVEAVIGAWEVFQLKTMLVLNGFAEDCSKGKLKINKLLMNWLKYLYGFLQRRDMKFLLLA